MIEKFHLYYTNDLHSNFKQWPKVAAFMNKNKAKREAQSEDYWLIDIGDHVDRVHPIAEAFMGKANVALMNRLGYDVATIGNNEGITLPHDDLFHLYDDADFDVVCGNLNSLTEVEPEWLQTYTVKTSSSGVKFGFIGLTAPFNAFYELLDWHISEPFHVLDRYIEALDRTVDIIVLLSHLGIYEDEAIAKRYPEIDVIIGGHTHHLLRTGKYVNNTVLTAGGKHCEFAGHVILEWDHHENKLTNKEAYTIDTTHLEDDSETYELLEQLEREAEQKLGETVACIKEPIEAKWFEDTKVMQELTNTLKQWTNAEAAMLNAGLILDHLPAGNVTYKDIHHICPHPINPVIIELSGNELIEVARVSFTDEFTKMKLKGFGFRGKLLGRMLFAGLKVETDLHSDGREYVTSVKLANGDELDSSKKYKVATADTFTFGRMLPPVARSEVKKYFLPEFLRDLLADTLKNKFSC